MNYLESTAPLIAYLPISTHSTISEILGSMRRCEIRNQNHHTEKRIASRMPYDNWVAIVSMVEPDFQFVHSSINVCAFLRGRNISTSGLSVVGSHQLDPVTMTDDTPPLRLSQILQTTRLCSVAFPSKDGMNMKWVCAQVVRTRDTEANLLEIGMRFLKQLPDDHPLHRDAEELFKQYRMHIC